MVHSGGGGGGVVPLLYCLCVKQRTHMHMITYEIIVLYTIEPVYIEQLLCIYMIRLCY